MAQPAHAIARQAACVHLFTGVATEAGRPVITFRANKPSAICCGDYWGIPTVQPGRVKPAVGFCRYGQCRPRHPPLAARGRHNRQNRE